MSLLRPRREYRSLSYQDVWGSGGDWANYRTGPALTLGAVYACARLIAASVARMPIQQFRMESDGTGRLIGTSPIFRTPCRREKPFAWKYRSVSSLVLRGETFGIPVGTASLPTQMHWVNNNLVTVNDAMYPDVAAEYWYRSRHLADTEIVHMTAFVEPGSVRGLSPIAVFKKTWDAGLAAQEYGLEWFSSGGQPSGVLKSEMDIPDDVAERLQKRWRDKRRNGGIAVLGSGADYQQVQVAADEAQFIQAQQFSVSQVARIFGVPPEMIGGDSGNAMTYSNREQRAIDFVTLTLAPYITALEEHFSDFLPAPQFVRLDTTSLLSTDLKSQLEANAIGIASHQITPTEARATRNLGPLTPDQQAELQAVPLTITPGGKPKSTTGSGTGTDSGTQEDETP